MLGECHLKDWAMSSQEEGRVLNAGCFLRYSTQKFYDNSTSDFVGENEGECRF